MDSVYQGHSQDFSKGVTLCQNDGTHQIIMSFSPPAVGCLLKSKCTEISRIAWPRSKFNFPFFRVQREVLITFQRFWGLFFQIRPTFGNI